MASEAALTNGYVTAVNRALGLNAPTAIPTVAATGAFSICSVLSGTAAESGVQVLDGTD